MMANYEAAHPAADGEAFAKAAAKAIPEPDRATSYDAMMQEYDRTQAELYKALDEGRREDAQKLHDEDVELAAVANELQRLMNPSPPTSAPSSPASAPSTPLGARQPSLGPDPFAAPDVDEQLYEDIIREAKAAEHTANTLASSPTIYSEPTRAQSQKVLRLSAALKREVEALKIVREQGGKADARKLAVFGLEHDLAKAKQLLDTWMKTDQKAARTRRSARKLFNASQLGQATDPTR